MIKGYGICLNEWLQDTKIKNELRLLIRIASLTAEKGFCFASNEYFAEYFKMHISTVSAQIKKLEKRKYLKIKYEYNGCHITKREIKMLKPHFIESAKYDSTNRQNARDNNIIPPPTKLGVDNSINNQDNIRDNSFLNLCLEDDIYKNAFVSTTKTNIYTIEHYLDKFNKHLIQTAKPHPSIRDYKEHFTNWLNRQGKIAKMYEPAPTNLRYT